MPIYTGDKLGFGVAPASGSGVSYEVGYSTSFDNISHTKRVEHVWIVPKTARYNFEVWGADGGAGLAINGDNTSGGIPRYGRGGKVECSMELTVGTEIGICIGDNGLFAFAYTGSNTGNFLNDGEGGWGGFKDTAGQSHADGGNSNYNMHQYGGGSNSPPRNFRGAGGGGGTIVRLYNQPIANGGDNDLLIIAGGGGGAGCRGDDHGNSNNQGGSGGNANDKVGETQWGRRGERAGDTSYGWPSPQYTAASSGQSNAGGNGGVGYYAGGAGGGGGDGGGGAGATCSYCGTSGGSGGSSGQDGYNGSGGYNQSSGGAATSKGGGSYTKLGCGGNSNPSGGTGGNGGGGGGGYRGGGAGYWGNGSGHAGAGGGGGASSYVTSASAYQVKGLNGIEPSPRYTSEQKPLRLGNPGGGRVFIWEANKDPLGKNRPAVMTAQKIQYASRSTNGQLPTLPLYYLGSSSTGDAQDGGGPHYAAYNNYPYDIAGNKCDAIVMNVAGGGQWELHSVTVGQAQGYDYPLPYRHQAWVHVIEGTETGGVGIHTEKFDLNNTTGNPAVAGWYGHMRAGAKQQNTNDGYQELFFEKPAVMNQGENYTIAVDWSCGGTVNGNSGGVACMNNGGRTTQILAGTNTGTVTWSDVTAYNGPHGLGTKNSDNGMVTDSAQGQLVNFGIKSYNPPGGGGNTYYIATPDNQSGNSYVDLGANLFPSNDYLQYTVEVWCRPLQTPSGQCWIIDQHPGGNGRLFMGADNGNLAFFSGGMYNTSTSFGSTGTWAHLAFVANGNGSVTIFKDGVLIGTSPTSRITMAPDNQHTLWGQDTTYGVFNCEYRGFRINRNRVYTTNFTPPSIDGGLTNISGTVALWDGLTGSAIDASGTNTWSSTNMTFSEVGGGGGAYSTTDLIVDLDASKSSSYGGSGNTWYNIINGSGIDFTIDGASYNGSEGSGSFYFDGSNDIVYSNSNYDLSSYNYIFVDMAFKADNSTQIHLPFEHSQSWNSNSGAFGFAVHTDGNNSNLNEHHSNHNGGSSANWNYTVGTGWAVYGCQFAKTGSDTRKQYMNGQIVDFTNGNQYASPGSSFGNYVMYIGSRYGGVAPAKGYIGYVRVYASSSPLSASTISSNYDAIKSRYGLS